MDAVGLTEFFQHFVIWLCVGFHYPSPPPTHLPVPFSDMEQIFHITSLWNCIWADTLWLCQHFNVTHSSIPEAAQIAVIVEFVANGFLLNILCCSYLTGGQNSHRTSRGGYSKRSSHPIQSSLYGNCLSHYCRKEVNILQTCSKQVSDGGSLDGCVCSALTYL